MSQIKADYDQNSGKVTFAKIFGNITNMEKIVKISCGSNHSVALSNKGVVFAWGCSNNGRLGLKKEILKLT